MDADFVNLYIETFAAELNELSKVKVLHLTRLKVIEKVNAELLKRLEEKDAIIVEKDKEIEQLKTKRTK